MAWFGRVEIPDAELARLTDDAFVERLVERGVSRLTAHRIVAIQRGSAEPGRARRHAQARS
jgi:hypothetical protein